MRASAPCAIWIIGALSLAVLPALAQEADAIKAAREAPLTPEESSILRNALVFDPAAVETPPKKPFQLRASPESSGYAVKRTDKIDGSSTIVVKQPLQTEWENSAGADLPASNTGAGNAFDRPLSTRDNSGSGSAWASIGVPNVGSVDARVDSSNEQGKLGTTLKHSIPFGGRFSVTFQDTLSVTETLAQPTAGADMPLMALPPSTAPTSPQVFGNERAMKFNILPTGTTLGAGMTTASNDPVTHNTLSAEQKLYGPLQVTTAITDFGQTTSSKKVSAGFRLNW
ncbi:MAG TPA: hypothetical protein VEJ43_13870 [Pseudolabrys sp.]|nr:hypothetical protein [Pseudolabrys sp.]